MQWPGESPPTSISFATIALLHDDEWIGNLNLSRTEVRPFDPKRRPILQAFADQAAIAVANAKLFNDLDAALERQTAMTDVLDAVSTARLDLQPVFDRIVEHAQRSVRRHLAASRCATAPGLDAVRRRGPARRATLTESRNAPADPDRRDIHDCGTCTDGRGAAHPGLGRATGGPVSRTRGPVLSGLRDRCLTLPMRRARRGRRRDQFLRSAPGGYTDDEIALLQAFTDQAAIAVDNARLLREIEQRNHELSESLEFQTATSRCCS